MTEQDPARYIVFPLKTPTRWLAGKAKDWMAARELGAKKLQREFGVRLSAEDVWAVAVYDGETDEDALRRGIEMKGGK